MANKTCRGPFGWAGWLKPVISATWEENCGSKPVQGKY
jgi:hypothetical protein